MTTKIATIANLAFQTFQQYSLSHKLACTSSNCAERSSDDHRTSDGGTASSDSRNSKQSSGHLDFLRPLCSSVHSLTLKDVGFKRWWVSDFPDSKAPVLYVHITENTVFSMGIFILRPGSRIPLHDHPGMHGVLRVLYGSLHCRSFTFVGNNTNSDLIQPLNQRWSSPVRSLSDSPQQSSNLLAARLHSSMVVTTETGSLIVSPTEGNLHEITATNGSAVFIDILAPPYDRYPGERDCHFYEEVIPSTEVDKHGGVPGNETRQGDLSQPSSVNNSNDGQSPLVYFREISQPRDYWCDSVKYSGPSLN